MRCMLCVGVGIWVRMVGSRLVFFLVLRWFVKSRWMGLVLLGCMCVDVMLGEGILL